MDVNTSDGYPLHSACKTGDVHLVRQLISEGHMVNLSNFDLVQPLHEACFNGQVACVKLLLEEGAQDMFFFRLMFRRRILSDWYADISCVTIGWTGLRRKSNKNRLD